MRGRAARAAALLGGDLRAARPLHGGDLSEVVRLELADGRSVVAKFGDTACAEARMLRAIASAGVPAPEVLAVSGELLVMSDLGADEGPAVAWSDLGHVLARLHGCAGAGYGWPRDHAFGSVAISNAPSPDWPAFWAERRLLPMCSQIAPDLARRVERLAALLTDLLPRAPTPALLHGDLWSGNIMARAGRVTGLIDPACYHGHGEVDLAMLCLFAQPSADFDRAYGALASGADERRPVYQLWPALVHLSLFGAAYRGLVERFLREAGE